MRRCSRLMRVVTPLVVLLACAAALPAAAGATGQTLSQAISDRAQSTTIAFAGLGLLTGNLNAQSFYPPGKVADYFGFQYLRDNDPSDMGHNTSFLTRAACNVIRTLDATQTAELGALAVTQAAETDQYAYDRYPLMQAFRRLVDGDAPAGTDGLSETAVVAASRELYLIDGQMSYERAVAYADVIRSFSAAQRAYLDAMVGKGWADWPAVDETDPVVQARLKALPKGMGVAFMSYAGDIFSWYAGGLDADVYFCPERHGTYYGSFYMKDAPAVGVPGYSIDEQLTATAGSALCDPTKGYVTADQAKLVNDLVDQQRDNLYAGTQSIVQARTDIATVLRTLLVGTPDAARLAVVRNEVLDLSAEYGELDGEDNYLYASAFAALDLSLKDEQRTKLADLRHSILSGTYDSGAPFDFTTCATPYLYSAVIADTSVLAPYLAASDGLFAPATPSSYTITATASVGGTIAPAGVTTVAAGGSQSYTLTPATGYHVGDLVVDGVSVGALGSYTFSSVAAAHTIAASFERNPALTVTASLTGTAWAIGAKKTVTWSLATPVGVGSFRVWATPKAGGTTRAVSTTVVPVVAGQAAYSLDCTWSLPAGEWILSVYYYDAAGAFKAQNTVRPVVTAQ